MGDLSHPQHPLPLLNGPHRSPLWKEEGQKCRQAHTTLPRQDVQF